MTRILVTGSAGFIGSNFVRHVLAHTDWTVVGMDRIDSAGDQNRCADLVGPRYMNRWHDFRAAVNEAQARCLGAFDYVVHMAAASHVTRSVTDPIGFVMDNVVGTAHVLDYVRKMPEPPRKVLYFSTDEVFGPAPVGVSYDEYSAHTPNNPYAASKAAAEALCPAWANTYGLPICVTHCTNVYGPGQHEEKFIPLVTRKVLNGEVVQIHADAAGQPSSRYYVHVNDVSWAVLTVLLKGGLMQGPGTGKYNISGDQEHSNLDVAKAIAGHLGMPLEYELVSYVADRPRHDMRYDIRSTRLERLGWKPVVPLSIGLEQTIRVLREAA